ncbi:MAG: hypothetical protein JWQ97_298 [Phenylobacterium sp.]|nr:hypothetical protein [Phenylobacterium sp.]
MSRQWLRKASLIVSGQGEAIDLAELRFTFKIKQYDLQTPSTAYIRIYNLTENTANKIQKEFTSVTLNAGYQDNFGTIFVGTIIQVRRGRESATDTYVDIIAADGDDKINTATISLSVGKGTTFDDRLKVLTGALGVRTGQVAPLPSGALPRGRVFYGAAKDHLRDFSFSTGTRWSIQRGMFQALPLNGYLPGEAVVLSSATGMLGMPEQTEIGIRVKCLLNPRIGVGTRVQIDNKSIQQATLNLSNAPGGGANGFLPRITDDGFYRTCVAELSGDTRGNDWTSDLICIAAGDPVTQALNNRGYV